MTEKKSNHISKAKFTGLETNNSLRIMVEWFEQRQPGNVFIIFITLYLKK